MLALLGGNGAPSRVLLSLFLVIKVVMIMMTVAVLPSALVRAASTQPTPKEEVAPSPPAESKRSGQSFPERESVVFLVSWERQLAPSEVRSCRFALKCTQSSSYHTYTNPCNLAELSTDSVNVTVTNADELFGHQLEMHMIGGTNTQVFLKSPPFKLTREQCRFVVPIQQYYCMVQLSVAAI